MASRGLKRTLLVMASLGIAIFVAQAQQPSNQRGIGDKDGLFSPANGLQLPRLVRPMPVVYPAQSGSEGVKGSCTLSLVIGPDGLPAKYRIVHSMGGAFDAAAIKAVSDSTFQPGKIGGVPAAVWIDVWIPFRADRSPSQPEILPLKHVDQPPMPVSAAEAAELHATGKAKFSGDVEVSVLVTEEGLPASLHVARPLGLGLDQKALDEVSQYHFKPAMKDGNPVPMRIDVRVSIRLN